VPGASIFIIPARSTNYQHFTNSVFDSMFKEPGDSSPERVIAKVERTAASSRSAIRRERTIRDTDIETSRHSGDRNENHVRSGSPAGGRATDLLFQARPRTQVIVGQTGGRDVSHPTPELWGSMFEAARRRDHRGIRNAVRMQFDDELRQSSLSQTRQRPSQSMTTTTRQRARVRTPWVNQSILTRPSASTEPLVSPEEQVLLARPYMPSPPYSFSDNTATGLRPRGTDGNITTADLTPGFAPARGVLRDNRGRESAVPSNPPRHHTPPGESSWTASYPPLRRVSHFSPRHEPNLFSQAGNGGLGDRRRSISSSSEAEHDPWETLLTTMEPDTHLPSTDSSFTSGTASQSTIRPQNTSVSRDTSFASATTATQRFLSRPTSPTSRNPANAGERDMDLDIDSTQYEGLSEESRGSMRTMLDIIQNARQFRANSPVGDVNEFLRPQPNERFSLANRRQRAREYMTVAELCHQDDENRILSTHLAALREMDELRTTTNIRPRRMANTNMTTWQRAHHHTSDVFNPTENVNDENDNRQPRLAQDLLRTMEQQTRQIARELENMQENEPTPTNGPVLQSRALSPDSTTTSEEMENVQHASQRVASTADLRTVYHAASRTGRR
jgi:hypothetical protein